MIGINMSMPDNCYKCQFNDSEDLCYIDGTYAIADLMTKPNWCPLINLDKEVKNETN